MIFFLLAAAIGVATVSATTTHDESKVLHPTDEIEFLQVLQEIVDQQRNNGDEAQFDDELTGTFSWSNCNSPLPINVATFNLSPGSRLK